MTRLLLYLLPAEIAGDIEEEFGSDSRRLRVQVMRSLVPLMWRGIQRNYGGALACALPMLATDRLWSYILSQVPLKASDARNPEFWLLEAAAGLAGAWLFTVACSKGNLA